MTLRDGLSRMSRQIKSIFNKTIGQSVVDAGQGAFKRFVQSSARQLTRI